MRGFTLIETIAVLGLGAVVLLLALQLFLPSLWMFKKEQAAVEAHQTSLVVMQRLSGEISNSLLETMTLARLSSDVPVALSLVDVVGFSAPSRTLLLDSAFQVFYYRRSDKTLCSFTWKPADGVLPPGSYDFARPPRLTPAHLGQLVDHCPPHVLARHVEDFQIQDGDGSPSPLNPPLALSVKVQVPVGEATRTGQVRFEVSSLATRVAPRSVRW